MQSAGNMVFLLSCLMLEIHHGTLQFGQTQEKAALSVQLRDISGQESNAERDCEIFIPNIRGHRVAGTGKGIHL